MLQSATFRGGGFRFVLLPLSPPCGLSHTLSRVEALLGTELSTRGPTVRMFFHIALWRGTAKRTWQNDALLCAKLSNGPGACNVALRRGMAKRVCQNNALQKCPAEAPSAQSLCATLWRRAHALLSAGHTATAGRRLAVPNK